MTVRVRTAIALAALLTACGGARPEERVIARTPDDGARGAGGPGADGVEALVARDDAAAADALDSALGGGGDTASLAAAYAHRLGLGRDRAAVRAAIARGASSGDALVAALCWRWIASGDLGEPPAWAGATRDPAAAALAAAAFARKAGGIPKPLEDALGLPEGRPKDGDPPVDRARIGALVSASGPFDDGALGRAIAFVEARRERWVDEGRGGREFAARALRDDLLSSLGGGPAAFPGLPAARPARDPAYSQLAARLLTPLAGAPRKALRGAAVAGKGALRIEALRALAIAARRPEAGDLGAAAAGLAAPEEATRIEAARTYLLLAVRAE